MVVLKVSWCCIKEFELLAELKACASLAACAAVIERCRGYAEGTAEFKGRRRPPSYWRRQQRRGKIGSRAGASDR
jgi:hypothetical protein